VCKVAPIPGQTKVWQYITLIKNIFLVDCPGIVYPSGDTETQLVLKGVVRIENIGDAVDHISEVTRLVKREYLDKSYSTSDWADHIEFLTQFAKRSGKLLKGGEPDINTAAKMILMDWQRGRIPFYMCPPEFDRVKPEEDENKKFKVNQQFKKISVSAEFSEADKEGDMDIASEDEDITDWDQVYKDDANGEEASEEEEDEENAEETVDTEENVDNSEEDVDAEEDVDEEDVDGEDVDEESEESEDEDNAQRGQFVRAVPVPRPSSFLADGALPSTPSNVQIKSGKAKRQREEYSDDDEPKPKKEKRMTTNKKKSKNYYDDANVKNKHSRRTTTISREKKVRHQSLVSNF